MLKKWMKYSIQIVLTLVLSTSSITALGAEEENTEFDQYLMDEFVETMESDYLTLHYTVKDYESYHINLTFLYSFIKDLLRSFSSRRMTKISLFLFIKDF